MLGRAVDDVKALARAEADVAKAKASAKLRRYRGAAVAFGAAIGLATAATVALAVGVLMSLVPILGPALATLATTLGFGLLAYFAARVGAGKL